MSDESNRFWKITWISTQTQFLTKIYFLQPSIWWYPATLIITALFMTVDPAHCSAQASTNKNYIYIHCETVGGKQKYKKKIFLILITTPSPPHMSCRDVNIFPNFYQYSKQIKLLFFSNSYHKITIKINNVCGSISLLIVWNSKWPL